MYTFTEHDWLLGISLFCAVIAFGNGLHFLVFRLVRRRQTEAQRRILGVSKHMALPARAVLLTIGALIVLPLVPKIPVLLRSQMDQALRILLVLFVGWLAIGAVYVFQGLTLNRFDITVPDNLRARRVHTQMQFFRRILIGIVIIFDAAALLWSMHDPTLWRYGTGLLASAGLASLLLAAAAKSTVSNLIAGMQIALSEPIRMDDVVIIQGEWGRIEEITNTYVVVKIWDERRLVVPLSYFIEQPFQNWTRKRSDILGTAFLYVDYTVPVEPLRAELARIARASSLWDGRVCGLQVTNLSERTMELRCLVSSAGSSENFDLRCIVREKMIEFLREHYPSALPTARFEIRSASTTSAEDAQALFARPSNT